MGIRIVLAAFVSAVAVFAGTGASAQNDAWPSKPVRIVVPYAAGGPADTIARLYAKELGERLSGTFYIENRTGAGTNIGAAAVYSADADGYTFGISNLATNSLNKHSYSKLTYDPDRFVGVGMFGIGAFYLAVGLQSPVNSVADLVKLAKSRPLTFGSNGLGSPGHLLAELFKQTTGINAAHVPYKGAAESNADLMAGRLDFMFDGGAINLIKAGKLKGIAIANDERWPGDPWMQTMPEAGYPNVTLQFYFGLMAPPGTPRPVVEKLNAEIAHISNNVPWIKEKLLAIGMVPLALSLEGTQKFLSESSAKWEPVIKSIGLKFD